MLSIWQFFLFKKHNYILYIYKKCKIEVKGYLEDNFFHLIQWKKISVLKKKILVKIYCLPSSYLSSKMKRTESN